MRPKLLSIAPYAAANATAIAAAQTPAAGGVQFLTLTSSPYVQDVPRQVVLTFAGNESARFFYIEGTDYEGRYQLEALAGTATTATTVRAFATVTAIAVDGNTAAAVSAGTTTIVSTNWFPMDSLLNSFEAGLLLNIPAGNVGMNMDVVLTMSRLGWDGDNPNSIKHNIVPTKFGRIHPVLISALHDTLAAEAVVGAYTGNIVVPVTAIRLRSNAVFTGAAITLNIAQTGHGP